MLLTTLITRGFIMNLGHSCKLFHKVVFVLSFCFFVSCKTVVQKIEAGGVVGGHQSVFSDSQGTKASVGENPETDLNYSEKLSRWQRDVTLYQDFEIYYTGTATIMSPEMKENYKQQVLKVQGEKAKIDKNIIPDDNDVVSVVVSFYTTFAKYQDFEENKIWTKALFYHNKWIEPSSVVYYRNKSSLAPYFSVGTFWSRMYVLQFRDPDFVHWNANHSQEEQAMEFSVHSGIAKADYYWRWCGKSMGSCK